MITGGYGSGRDTAEVWQPGLGAPCSLPNLPEDRRYHTQEGRDICGGEGGEKPERQYAIDVIMRLTTSSVPSPTASAGATTAGWPPTAL